MNKRINEIDVEVMRFMLEKSRCLDRLYNLAKISEKASGNPYYDEERTNGSAMETQANNDDLNNEGDDDLVMI